MNTCRGRGRLLQIFMRTSIEQGFSLGPSAYACLPYSQLQSSAAALSGFPPTHPLSSPLLLPFPYYSFRKYLLHNYSLSSSGETLMNELTGSLSRWRAWNKLKTGVWWRLTHGGHAAGEGLCRLLSEMTASRVPRRQKELPVTLGDQHLS